MKWWDGYQGEKTVIIDDLITNEWIDKIDKLTDKYPFRVETKFGSKEVAYNTIIFISSYNSNLDRLNKSIINRFEFLDTGVWGNTNPDSYCNCITPEF